MRTNNLNLRNVQLNKIEESDLPLLLEWRNSPDVNKYFFNRNYITPLEHKEWFQSINNEQNLFCLIVHNNIQKGLINIKNIDRDKLEADWGIYLAKDSYRGQKTGAIAGIILLDYVFNVMKLQKIHAQIVASNVKSERFHESIGFIKCINKSKPESIEYTCIKSDYFKKRKVILSQLEMSDI